MSAAAARERAWDGDGEGIARAALNPPNDDLVYGGEMAVRKFLLEEPFGFGLEFEDHIHNIAAAFN